GGRIGGESFGAGQPASASNPVPETHVVLDRQLNALSGCAEHVTSFAQECVCTFATGDAFPNLPQPTQGIREADERLGGLLVCECILEGRARLVPPSRAVGCPTRLDTVLRLHRREV